MDTDKEIGIDKIKENHMQWKEHIERMSTALTSSTNY